MQTVRVACSIVNGVELRIFEHRRGEFGIEENVETGRFTLNGPRGLAAGTDSSGKGEPAVTEVPSEFWRAWRGQNEGSPLLQAIREVGADSGAE